MNLRRLENTVAVQVAILLVTVTGCGSLVYGVINIRSGVGKIIRCAGSPSGIGRYKRQIAVQPVAEHIPVRIRENSEIIRLVIHPLKVYIYRLRCHEPTVAEFIKVIRDIYFLIGKSHCILFIFCTEGSIPGFIVMRYSGYLSSTMRCLTSLGVPS